MSNLREIISCLVKSYFTLKLFGGYRIFETKLNFVESTHTAYIGLGSNRGDRVDYLQKAVNLIFNRIGEISQLSPIYETPSWGYEGADFLNLCLEIKTRFSPQNLLKKLLCIETDLGRTRHQQGYEDRFIDLDLLFYEEEVINTKKLVLPHPEITHRRFVLQPLVDIAPDFQHPHYRKSLSTLLKETRDRSVLKIHSLNLQKPSLSLDEKLNYLVIEGNIGAGKTSLARMLAEDYKAKLITERFKDNPFLPKFYENQKRYAFPLEMSFLADRYQQAIEGIGQYELFKNLVIADYDSYKSLIFAGVTLGKEEFILYKRLFHIMYKDVIKPDLYVYLYQNTERLLKNIEKRGREYEQNIPSAYLEKINKGYLNFIKTQDYFKVKIIDISELDFVAQRQDYLSLIQEINKAL